MKKELELKDIAPYLPYKLRWRMLDSQEFIMSGITKTTLFTENGAVLNWNKIEGFPQVLFPVFRPLSQLTQEIEVDGNRFVPIIELWQSYEADEFNEHRICDMHRLKKYNEIGRFDNTIVNKRIFTDYFVKYNIEYNIGVCEMEFGYSVQLRRFYARNNTDRRAHSVSNQIDMFQKLFEWHFDVFNLIGLGLAISIEDICN